MSESPVRLALVGHPDEIAVWAEVAPRLRGGRVTTIADSMGAALGNAGEFDAAVVRSSADARCAAASSKHVLVAAPVADSIDEVKSVVEACEQAGVSLAVGRIPRHAPANRTIMDRLAAGKLGDPGLLRVHRWHSKRDQSLPTRIYGDIDLAMQLFGARPADIYAIGRGDGVYVQIHLGFPAGGMALLDFSERLSAGQDYDSLSLIGSKGAAHADDHHNAHLLFAGDNPTALISNSGNGHLYELQAFVDGIVHQAEPSIDGESVLAVHLVIDAAQRSIASYQVLRDQGGVYEPA